MTPNCGPPRWIPTGLLEGKAKIDIPRREKFNEKACLDLTLGRANRIVIVFPSRRSIPDTKHTIQDAQIRWAFIPACSPPLQSTRVSQTCFIPDLPPPSTTLMLRAQDVIASHPSIDPGNLFCIHPRAAQRERERPHSSIRFFEALARMQRPTTPALRCGAHFSPACAAIHNGGRDECNTSQCMIRSSLSPRRFQPRCASLSACKGAEVLQRR